MYASTCIQGRGRWKHANMQIEARKHAATQLIQAPSKQAGQYRHQACSHAAPTFYGLGTKHAAREHAHARSGRREDGDEGRMATCGEVVEATLMSCRTDDGRPQPRMLASMLSLALTSSICASGTPTTRSTVKCVSAEGRNSRASSCSHPHIRRQVLPSRGDASGSDVRRGALGLGFGFGRLERGIRSCTVCSEGIMLSVWALGVGSQV